jgi:hypothetical protein
MTRTLATMGRPCSRREAMAGIRAAALNDMICMSPEVPLAPVSSAHWPVPTDTCVSIRGPCLNVNYLQVPAQALAVGAWPPLATKAVPNMTAVR